MRGTDSGDEAILKQLFPDQVLRREEQKRFEILLAHWDVPIALLTWMRNDVGEAVTLFTAAA